MVKKLYQFKVKGLRSMQGKEAFYTQKVSLETYSVPDLATLYRKVRKRKQQPRGQSQET